MSIEHELREAAKPINGWAKPGQADLMLRAADELSRLREVERRAVELVRRWVSWCDDWHPGKSHPFDDIEAAKAFLSEREGQE